MFQKLLSKPSLTMFLRYLYLRKPHTVHLKSQHRSQNEICVVQIALSLHISDALHLSLGQCIFPPLLLLHQIYNFILCKPFISVITEAWSISPLCVKML